MSIINVFKSEKELFDFYPKKFYFSLKDIFNDYWDNFLDFANSKNLIIRDLFFTLVNLVSVILVVLNILNNVLLLLNLNLSLAIIVI